MKRPEFYSIAFSGLFACQGPALAADGSNQASEVERLKAQIERLQEQTKEQKRVISTISKRLEKLEQTQTGSDSAAGDIPKAELLSNELQQIAGKGAPKSGSAGTTSPAPGTDEEEIVKEAQPSKSVQDVLREEHALFSRRLTIEPGVTYSYSDRRQLTLTGFLALDAIFLGNISVDRVKNHITTFDLNGRYGFTDNMEVELNVPFLYRRSNFQSGGVGGAANVLSDESVDEANIGDISARVFYRLARETQTRPDIVMNVGFRAPSGTDPYGIPTVTDPNNANLTFPAELPTGNGVWGVMGGISAVKTIDPAIVFANVGYTYNIEESFGDISANPGSQPGDVKLGDWFNFGFGTAFALNERFSLSLSYAQQFHFESEIQQAGQPSEDVVGSDANVATVNIGSTYALTDTTSFVTNVGLGLTDDASDVTVTFRMPFQL